MCVCVSPLQEQTGSGLAFRVYLPPLASCRLVRRCLAALRLVLPRDVALRLVGRWYAQRHAPGFDPARPAEHVDFARFVLLAAGYAETWPVLALLTGGPSGPGCGGGSQPAKRMRRGSGAAGDEHFAELLVRLSRPESQASCQLLPSEPRPKEDEAAPGPELHVTASMLGKHLPGVLFALHLVYEVRTFETDRSTEV